MRFCLGHLWNMRPFTREGRETRDFSINFRLMLTMVCWERLLMLFRSVWIGHLKISWDEKERALLTLF